LQLKGNGRSGTLKHRLVSYVMKYNKDCFMYYVVCVVQEMKKRKIKYQEKYYKELCKFCEQDKPSDDLYYPEHNDRYLKQCYYNLQEKYDRRNYN
jgi:uncharacterized protein (TIGR02328 family)